jgi:hypothetical protein
LTCLTILVQNPISHNLLKLLHLMRLFNV